MDLRAMCVIERPACRTTSTGTPSARRRTFAAARRARAVSTARRCFATSTRTDTRNTTTSPMTTSTMMPLRCMLGRTYTSLEREDHPERRALPGLRFDLDAAAVSVRDALDD